MNVLGDLLVITQEATQAVANPDQNKILVNLLLLMIMMIITIKIRPVQ